MSRPEAAAAPAPNRRASGRPRSGPAHRHARCPAKDATPACPALCLATPLHQGQQTHPSGTRHQGRQTAAWTPALGQERGQTQVRRKRKKETAAQRARGGHKTPKHGPAGRTGSHWTTLPTRLQPGWGGQTGWATSEPPCGPGRVTSPLGQPDSFCVYLGRTRRPPTTGKAPRACILGKGLRKTPRQLSHSHPELETRPGPLTG